MPRVASRQYHRIFRQSKTLARFVVYTALMAATLYQPGAAAQAPIELSLYTWRTQEKPLWDEINRQQLIPGVRVNAKSITYNAAQPYILLELQNNTADLFQWTPGAANLKPLIEQEFIRPYPDSLNTINASAKVASQGPDGRYYGVPFALQLQALLVNQKLVNKHGIGTEPRTIEALESHFSALLDNNITPVQMAGTADWYISQLVSEVMLAGLVNGADAQAIINGEQCFTDAPYQTVFDTLHRWKQAGYINSNVLTEDYPGVNNAVALGNAAMSPDGGWKTSPLSTYYQIDPDYQFGFWGVPGAGNKVYALGDGSYQVNHNSRHADAAYKVLAFTTTATFAQLFVEHVKELPAYNGQLTITDPVLKRMNTLVSERAYAHSFFSAYALNRQEPSYKTAFISAFRQLMAAEISPKQATRAIQDSLNSWGYVGASRCQ